MIRAAGFDVTSVMTALRRKFIELQYIYDVRGRLEARTKL
jgi:hypothetical protein